MPIFVFNKKSELQTTYNANNFDKEDMLAKSQGFPANIVYADNFAFAQKLHKKAINNRNIKIMSIPFEHIDLDTGRTMNSRLHCLVQTNSKHGKQFLTKKVKAVWAPKPMPKQEKNVQKRR